MVGSSLGARVATAALFTTALLGSATASEVAHDFWSSRGVEQLSQGEFFNTRLAGSDEGIVLSTDQFGTLLPEGAFVSPVHMTEAPFDAVMVGFDAVGQDDLSVTVQVRGVDQAGVAATRWQNVAVEQDVIFPGLQHGFQYRVRLTTHTEETPRFHYLTAEFGRVSEDAGESAEVDPREAGREFDALVSKPPVTSRSEWGAKPPKGSWSSHSPREIVVHHTSIPNQSQYQGAASIRGIQHFHQNGRGWMDIGYHFLIGPEGQIFQGRPETKSGAHVVPNRNKVGICVFGNFQGEDDMTEAAWDSLVQLSAWLSSRYGIDVDSKLTGHRNWMQTDCPGNDLYSELPALRQAVADLLAQGMATE